MKVENDPASTRQDMPPLVLDAKRLDRIEAILRFNQMHEPTCAQAQSEKAANTPDSSGFIPAVMVYHPDCDCWLAEDES